MKILIIDDSKSVHAYLNEIFGESFVFEDAYDGQEGVRLQASFHPDLVLLDWEMPVLTGIEALPQLRAMNSDVPIVMMTSKNSMSDIVLALEKGATDYLIKPFTKEIILEKIEQILGKKF